MDGTIAISFNEGNKMIKKFVICLCVCVIAGCAVGGSASVGGGSNGVGAGFSLGTGIRF
ncbi:hypothetical protein APJL_0724 [Actinobacillus pleuropneumoniae serovar 3 str. JL03]|uniref:Uncharacterized protein n=5 Tax=Actinobacillus TaxID=713 RepID=B0BP04_ACTPJ|nr:hypothetical protein APJL_0724 [Actinobacillus pleuropneumoniae serovar 3 str. JL03]ACE61418.1 hypothetical protein APP7_0766 [Actinobacillus pleuropneumoniae serovar 7 str. AP76]